MSKHTDKTRTTPPPPARPRTGVASALIWFAVGGLLTLVLASQPSWPWTARPVTETSLNWPQSDQVFPEFPRVLIIQLSTSAVFFLLLPLASFCLPQRLLGQPSAEKTVGFPCGAIGYGLMWVALAVFAASFFLPGTALAVARPALPEGAASWSATTGNAAAACWLVAVVLIWLAAILTSAARTGRVLGTMRKTGAFLPPRPTWGILIGDGVQLIVYPFFAAVAGGWFFDLICDSETFVPAGMMTHAWQASTGGGPFQLWEHMFHSVAWPTVLACIVPVVGLAPFVFARGVAPRSDERPPQADRPPAPDGDESPAEEQAGFARTVWTVRALLLATVSFFVGIVFLTVAVRRGSGADWPSCQAMGLNWWIALGVVAAMVASGVCLRIGVRGAVHPANTVFHGWIAAAVLLTIFCGATVARQLSSLSQRGLRPFGVEEMVYPHADLAYVSAVRLRVLEISNDLTTREADEGILSSENVALRELCDRLHKKLIAPTERAVIETQDAALLAGLAEVVATCNDQPSGTTAFDGTPSALATLMGEIREQATVLQLPIVVPGGRDRMGVYCLLGIVFIAYLAGLLAALAITVVTNRGLARSKTLRELTLAWHLGGLFAVVWIFLA